MRLITLLVRHGTEQYANAVDDLEALIAERLPETEHDLLVADTALPDGYEKRVGKRRVLVGSSNANWEFSGWDSAIAYLGNRIHEYDLVHLATSAIRALDCKYLDRLDTSALAWALGRGVVLGHIDYYAEPVTIFDRLSQAWLRSSCIFLCPHELDLMGSLVSIPDKERFFSGDPKAPFCATAPLSVNYQNLIVDWLTHGSTRWHSRFDLTPRTLDYFERKTLAILNEHMLSIRLRSHGSSMVDVTWLSAHKADLFPRDSSGAIPSWDRQVTARHVVLRHERSRLDDPGADLVGPGRSPRLRRRFARLKPDKASSDLGAELVAEECDYYYRSRGMDAARRFLWMTTLRHPWLLTHPTVRGALRNGRLRGTVWQSLSSPA